MARVGAAVLDARLSAAAAATSFRLVPRSLEDSEDYAAIDLATLATFTGSFGALADGGDDTRQVTAGRLDATGATAYSSGDLSLIGVNDIADAVLFSTTASVAAFSVGDDLTIPAGLTLRDDPFIGPRVGQLSVGAVSGTQGRLGAPVITSGAPGALTVERDGPATPQQIQVIVPGSAYGAAATATMRYRETGAPSWTTGHPLYRISAADGAQPGVNDVSVLRDGDFSFAAIRLTPGTSYDVEVTVDDGGSLTTAQSTFTTRALPGVAGAATTTVSDGNIATLRAAIAAASPGDVIEFSGDYDAGSDLFGVEAPIEGLDASFIYVRGANRTDSIRLNLAGCRGLSTVNGSRTANVVFENFTLVGPRTGGGPNSSLRSSGIELRDGSSNERLTFRDLIVVGFDIGVRGFAESSQTMIYNCLFLGCNLYADHWTEDNDSSGSWSEGGIILPGSGNAAWGCTVWGHGDALSSAQHAGTQQLTESRSVHFAQMLILDCSDDAFEADYGVSGSLVDSTAINTMTAVSLDPLFAGPMLIAGNIFANPGRQPFKFNDEASGYFLYHNTVILSDRDDSRSASLATWWNANNGAQNRYALQGNLVMSAYGPDDTRLIQLNNTGHGQVHISGNSWYPDGTIQYGSDSATNLADAQANLPAVTALFPGGPTQRNAGDIISDAEPFESIVLADFMPTESRFGIQGGTDFTGEIKVASPNKGSATEIAGITNTTPTPDKGNAGCAYVARGYEAPPFQYLDGLGAFQCRQVTEGATHGVTMDDIVPDAWRDYIDNTRSLTRHKRAWAAGHGALYRLVIQMGGHNDGGWNGLPVYDARGCERPMGYRLSTTSPDPTDIRDAISESNVYADGSPPSLHPYDGIVADWDRNRYLRFGGAPNSASGNFLGDSWELPFADESLGGAGWSQLPTPGNLASGSAIAQTWLDRSTGKVMIGSSDSPEVYILRPDGTMTSGISTGSNNLASQGVLVHAGGRMHSIGSGEWYSFVFDFATETTTTVSRDEAALVTGANLSSTVLADVLPSPWYDEARGSLWLWNATDASPTTQQDIFEYNLTTHAATQHTLMGDVMPWDDGGTQIRGDGKGFIEIPEKRVLLLFPSAIQAPYAVQLPDAA
ncbi:MAG: hypothetical protein AAF184_09780 [Pseudomonadota bacterium]